MSTSALNISSRIKKVSYRSRRFIRRHIKPDEYPTKKSVKQHKKVRECEHQFEKAKPSLKRNEGERVRRCTKCGLWQVWSDSLQMWRRGWKGYL